MDTELKVHYCWANTHFFAGRLPPLPVRWSKRLTRSAGLYRRRGDCAEIVLSQPILASLSEADLLSTLVHEMIHAWTDWVLRVKESHGLNFRSKMAEINGCQTQFRINIRHTYPLPEFNYRYLAHCTQCGAQRLYQRQQSGLACRNCCDRHNQGQWNSDFRLVFQRLDQHRD
jgi:predicted SprT family Zn-dependent metalloprotease